MGSTISQLYMICIDMYNIYFIIYTHTRILTIVYDFPDLSQCFQIYRLLEELFSV